MTDKDKIWIYLKKNGSITNWDCIRDISYTRLADVIWRWERKGIRFDRIRERNDKKHWTRYILRPEEAERAEKEGLICLRS